MTEQTACSTGLGDLDHLYLFPHDSDTFADAFGGIDGTYLVTRGGAGGLPVICEADLPVIDVIEDVPGGCLVHVGGLLNTVGALARFVGERDGARTLGELEIAINSAEQLLKTLGGLVAERNRGRWRPIDPDERGAWSAHLVAMNTQRMRADAEWRRRSTKDGNAVRMAA